MDDIGTTLRGRDAFVRATAAWDAAWTDDLAAHESRWEVLRCASLSANVVAVSWRVRWLPDSLLPLVRAGRLWPGMRVTFYDLMDRVNVVATFSWRKAFRLLLSAARTGELPLPEACVLGSSTLTFDAEGLLTRHEERLSLTPEFRALRVRNRRVARDTADYIAEWRRPPGVPPDEWDARIREALLITSVPGMGVLDIDGQSPRDVEDVTALLGLATAAVLAFGAVAGKMRADEVARLAQMRAMLGDSGTGDDDDDAGARMRSRRLLSRRANDR